VGFNTFVKMKCIFSIALEASFKEVAGVFLVEKHLSDAEVGSIKH